MGYGIGKNKSDIVPLYYCSATIRIGVLVLTLLAFPCVASAELYYNQLEGFSIDAPAGWTVKKSAQSNTIVKFVLRDDEDRIAVLSIASYQETRANVQLPLTADRMYDGFKVDFHNFTIRRLASGSIKIRSMNAVWNLFEITEPAQARIIGKHYHLRRNGKLYRVSIQTDSGKDFFDAVLPIAEKSISTLAFGL
jgi:hypothetical protein